MFFKVEPTLDQMQQATHPRLHVRDARDAHTVFEAVRQGFLRPVTRRLNEMERSMFVQSGAIFVWEECDDESGLKRWTDGRLWGQSRMREPYLFYDEKLPSDGISMPEQVNRAPAFRFVDSSNRNYSSSALLHQDRSGGHHTGLVKQAYSAWVLLSPHSKPRKWHLTAYFTYADLPSIPTVDRDPILARIIVPQGVYRGGKVRGKGEDGDGGPMAMTDLPRMVMPRDVGHGGATSPLQVPNMTASYAAVPGANSRLSEDQRMIQMLNSRYRA